MDREWQTVQTRGDSAQNGAKRCPDVDSVAKDRSGAGDNECGEMSRTAKCVHCFGAHGSRSGKNATCGPKPDAELAVVIISKFQKRKNASIACRPTAPVLKKSATRGPKIQRVIAL